MFIQIHTLTSYPSSLLNRDDVGLSKKVPFGGAIRTRISSQCLKRHWRTSSGEHAIAATQDPHGSVPMSIRSRRIFENCIRVHLEQQKIAPEIALAVSERLMSLTLGESVKKKEAKKGTAEGEENGKKQKSLLPTDRTVPRERIETNQVVVLGSPEIAFLQREAISVAKVIDTPEQAEKALQEHFIRERVKNLQTLRLGAGLDAALFGRMVTSDILARCDAAVHVAHAMTVHSQTSESDYFSVVDDLFAQGEEPQAGSGHIGTSEITSGLYYGYVVVDVPLLVSNVEGVQRKDWRKADLSLSSDLLQRLLHLIATVSPGAKLGSTAPYSYASAIVLEAGISQPRTFANAFELPVETRPDLLQNTYQSLSEYVVAMDTIYGNSNERRFLAVRPVDALHSIATKEEKGFPGMATWLSEKIRSEA